MRAIHFSSALASSHKLLLVMGQKRKQLSHAEIWDDSALLQSWDDALTEYKVFNNPFNVPRAVLAKTQLSTIMAYMRAANVSKM